jgi:hypothetical protein
VCLVLRRRRVRPASSPPPVSQRCHGFEDATAVPPVYHDADTHQSKAGDNYNTAADFKIDFVYAW